MNALVQQTNEWKLKLKSRCHTIDECWIWNGPKFSDGYGNCGSGYPDQRAHRASFIVFKGNINKGMWVLHKCDKPLCINPDHLYLGDCKQNVKDAIERGLFPRGKNEKKSLKNEKNGRSKITLQQVKEIQNQYIPYIISSRELGKKYNLSHRQILRILKGNSWKIN